MSRRDFLPFTASLVLVASMRVLKSATLAHPGALILAPQYRVIARGGLVDCTLLRPSEVIVIAALFGRPDVPVSVFEIADLLWPRRDGGPDSWHDGLEQAIYRCRIRLAPFGLTIGRPLAHYLRSAELAAVPAMARAA